MNQSVYLVTMDFFENPDEGAEVIKDKVKQFCDTEKLILILDPVMIQYFSILAQTNKSLLEKTVVEYYEKYENEQKNQLIWYELDEQCNFYISALGSLLLDLDFKTREVHAIGMIPLTFKYGNVFLFFSISPYDNEDYYNLISFKSFDKNYKSIVSQLIKKGIIKEEKPE